MAENFPNLGKEIVIQIEEAQGVPNMVSPKRTIPSYTIVQMAKINIKREFSSQQEKNNQSNTSTIS